MKNAYWVCDDIYLNQVMNFPRKTANDEIHTETERLKCPVVIPKQKLLTADVLSCPFQSIHYELERSCIVNKKKHSIFFN